MFEELIFIQFANVKDRVLKTDVLAKWLPYAEKVKNSEFDFSKSCATFVKNLFKGSRKKLVLKNISKVLARIRVQYSSSILTSHAQHVNSDHAVIIQVWFLIEGEELQKKKKIFMAI